MASHFSRSSAYALLDADTPWLGSVSTDPARGVVVRLTDLCTHYSGACDGAEASRQMLLEFGGSELDQMLNLLHQCWEGRKAQSLYSLRVALPGPNLVWELRGQLCFQLPLKPSADAPVRLRDELLIPLMRSAIHAERKLRDGQQSVAPQQHAACIESLDGGDTLGLLPDFSAPHWLEFAERWKDDGRPQAAAPPSGGDGERRLDGASSNAAVEDGGQAALSGADAANGAGPSGSSGGAADGEAVAVGIIPNTVLSSDEERRKRAQAAREQAANKARRK